MRRQLHLHERLIARLSLDEQGAHLGLPRGDLVGQVWVAIALRRAVGVEEGRGVARGDLREDQIRGGPDPVPTTGQRVGRPRRGEDTFGQRVGRAVVGLGGQHVDDETAGLDGGVVDRVADRGQQFGEEFRSAARFVARLRPVVRRDQQVVTGPGERDVEQPAVLLEATIGDRLLVGRDGVLEFLAVGHGVQVEHRISLRVGTALLRCDRQVTA